MKFPLVLVHGIAASDRIGFIDFWGRIPALLEERGIGVYLGNTDSWGSVKSNAALLKESVDAALLETGADKVNILAHSKGGIDSRYLIHAYGYGDRVASLTTIGTPHRGSELADLFLRPRPLRSLVARRALAILGSLFGDEMADPLQALTDISTESMAAFNRSVTDDGRVRYRSLYSAMEGPFDDPTFFFSHWYLRRAAGRNDGIVSEASARYWEDSREIKGGRGGISHGEIIDLKKRPISGLEIPEVYLELCAELESAGF